MYPRNAASPEPIGIGAVIQISDGAVQTSGCTVRIKPIGVAEGDGGGTTAYSTDGIVLYTPTQAETNYTSFILIAKKSSCIPVAITVITSASATAGYAGLDWGVVANKTTTNALTGTTIAVTQKVDVETIKTQTLTAAAGITFGVYVGGTGASALEATAQSILTDTAEIGAAGAGLTALATAANLATVAGYLDTEIAAILADTNELQTDWANGGRLDLILDARSSQTSVDTIDGIVDDILVDTAVIGLAGAGLTGIPWNASWDAEVQSECTDALNAYDPPTNTEMEARTIVAANYATASAVSSVLTTAMTESYSTDGSTATAAQVMYMVLAHLGECSIAGVTKTLKKLDGSTTAATFTLDSSTTPTSITRAS